MRKPLAIVLTVLGLTALAAAIGWAFAATSRLSGDWITDLRPIWPFVLGCVVVVAALTGGFMWLAFYSSRHGYDDRIEPDEPSSGS